jgi:hypothetical protein
VLKAWFIFAVKCALIQPSNASSERVFSMLNAGLSDRQERMLEDGVALNVMIRYNDLWRNKH